MIIKHFKKKDLSGYQKEGLEKAGVRWERQESDMPATYQDRDTVNLKEWYEVSFLIVSYIKKSKWNKDAISFESFGRMIADLLLYLLFHPEKLASRQRDDIEEWIGDNWDKVDIKKWIEKSKERGFAGVGGM
jgi:hypothetical protein